MNPFPLMKRAQIISFYHLQMPRWLFADPVYASLSLHAKVAYTFLLNRCQLSQRSGWVNDRDEVYIIFTREELAREMQISYRRAISCFAELTDAKLIWEVRRGRGLPNHIYLAQVEHDASASYACAPFTAPRPAECAGLAEESISGSDAGAPQTSEDLPEEMQENEGLPAQDMPEPQIKTCRADMSEPAEPAGQDLPELHPSNKYKNHTEMSETQSVRLSQDSRADRQVPAQLLQHCELEAMEQEDQILLRDAVGWLFYADEVRIGPCCYPQAYVRSRLAALDFDVLSLTVQRLRQNQKPIRGNALSYAAKVLFSCLTEREAQFSLDPGLNRLLCGREQREGCP